MVSMVIWSVKPILGTSKFNLTIYTPSIRFILVSPTKFNVFIGTISAYESFLFHNYRSNNMILLFIGILSALLQGSITGYATVSAESKSSLSSHSIIWYLKSHCVMEFTDFSFHFLSPMLCIFYSMKYPIRI